MRSRVRHLLQCTRDIVSNPSSPVSFCTIEGSDGASGQPSGSARSKGCLEVRYGISGVMRVSLSRIGAFSETPHLAVTACHSAAAESDTAIGRPVTACPLGRLGTLFSQLLRPSKCRIDLCSH